MRNEPGRNKEELLKRVNDIYKKNEIRKLELDEQGRLILDANNLHDCEWYFNDAAYEFAEEIQKHE